jgi:uncharacterized protein (TIGR03085 family)
VAEQIDERERRELCDLLEELGPDAPTLCEGWTTLDLAAHLVLREHFKRWTDDRMAAEKVKGLADIVQRLRAGAPAVPWRVPKLRTFMNGTEYFIHHEDVRRANGFGSRTDRPDLETLSWGMTSLTGRRLARQIRPHGLELRSPRGDSRRCGSSDAAVLIGEPTELLLFLSGRRSAAEVSFEGSDGALAAVRGTDSSL